MDPLDDLLKSYAAEPLPKPPDRFNAGVWEEIGRRRARPYSSLFNWADAFLQPLAVAAALVISILVGFTPALLREQPEARQLLATQSLHLDVFSVRSPTVRASLFQTSALAHRPR